MTKKHPVSSTPLLIDEANLTHAWARALLHIVDHSGTEIAPLILSISGFDSNRRVQEELGLRQVLDELLIEQGFINSEDVAYTIFPQRLWEMAQGDRAKLFEYYKLAFPYYQAMEQANRRGLYFQRLTMFGAGPCDGNQLEWILSQFNGRNGVRRSMFQATTFDPSKDHVATAQLGFPCLQHVSFEPTDGGLVANAFYATQQLFNKAYGNYLGLAQLAAFMAHEMKMPLLRLNVMIGVAKLDKITKTNSKLEPLIKMARLILDASNKPVNVSQTIEIKEIA